MLELAQTTAGCGAVQAPEIQPSAIPPSSCRICLEGGSIHGAASGFLLAGVATERVMRWSVSNAPCLNPVH